MDDQLLQHLKALDTIDVISWLGLDKGQGRTRYTCPWCDKPYMSVNLDRYGAGARCYYGACPGPDVKVYDNICLVQAVYGLEFLDACNLLAQQFGLSEGDLPQKLPCPPKRRRTGYKVREERIVCLLEQLYHKLELGEQGAAYLASRGIPEEVARDLGIKSVERLARWESLVGSLSPDEQEQCGLLYSDNTRVVPGHAPSLLIPYFDERGRLDSFRFRLIDGWTRYWALSGHAPQVPFLAQAVSIALEKKMPLYVTEGEIDAISLIVSGRCALSGSGAATWRHEWVEQWLALEEVIIIADADASGHDFAKCVLQACVEVHGRGWARTHVRALQCPPRIKDANELLQKKLLSRVLEEAPCWMEGGLEEEIDGWPESLQEDYYERLAIMVEGGKVEEPVARQLVAEQIRTRLEDERQHMSMQ